MIESTYDPTQSESTRPESHDPQAASFQFSFEAVQREFGVAQMY